MGAAVTAVIVHFTMYYTKTGVPGTSATGENPGVSVAVAIIASVLVGAALLKLRPGGEHEIS